MSTVFRLSLIGGTATVRARDSWQLILKLIVVAALVDGAAPSCCAAADFVIHISIDGLRPDYMQNVIDAGNAPNLQRLQEEGAWTNNARTDYTYSVTLPNHISMITGRPVSQPVGMPNTIHHGYIDNGTPLTTWTLHNQGNLNVPYKASTFDVVHDAGGATALYASKSKFVIFDQSYNATTGAAHANGSDKIDTFFAPEVTATMQSQLLTDIASQHFNYTFIHYADTDDVGHTAGWGSTTWMNALTVVDSYLGQVLNLVQSDPVLAGRTAVIVGADHGGTGTGHSDATSAFNYTVPLFVWGVGVSHGDLYALNSDTRVNPGTSRPSYVVAGQPIRNGDTGNLALALLELGPIPGSLINASQTLRVVLPGDYDFDGVVDAADYVVWRESGGSQSDYDTWRAHFGQTAGGGVAIGAQVAAPETTSPVALAMAAIGWRYTRRP